MKRNEILHSIQTQIEMMRDPAHCNKERWNELVDKVTRLYYEDGRLIVTLESRLTETKRLLNQVYGAQNG